MKITDKWLISFTECEFPDEWLGEWNLEGERISLNITKETFGTKGLCLKHDDDMGIYILSQRYCLHSRRTVLENFENFLLKFFLKKKI